ncbi:hypothetical protein LL936_10430 [Levilactobacillus brevis]|jgi:hypothetical protein|uniref:Uncharacterized protein n=4 Tax=Lactobacillaceae TaxID=33958 RepID=A0AAX1KE84_LACPN|nr:MULTISPECIES: hypothetical protein [Lactobacillaceae]TYA17228.1 hypothetical protein FXE14_15360 [Lactobacillus sp. LSI2-1]ANI96921.1 hypothetical protein A9F05_15240 [Lactiplantibacillus plantarum]AYG29427.1 hypothetical protein CFI62_15930 [Lactiplantibacillus plantarum]KRK99870.1 hypothetical protein FC88_GL000761 [Companilactobacillus futsaii JCM 17355]MBP5835560.1 hypothetical protein [Lactiplantibacillus plantarum]
MKIENWQDVDEHLVVDNDKAIIVKDSKLLDNPEALKTEMQRSGKPVTEVRSKLVQKSVKSRVKTDPIKISAWFDRKHESDNAQKAEKLVSNKPTHQYKQIKNEMTFFGESFLEGFLGFYGLEVDNALGRYEHNLHVLETQELGQSEKEYYLATSENGHVRLATDPLPSQQIAEEQLNKFYQREPEETQAEQIQLRTSEDDRKEE